MEDKTNLDRLEEQRKKLLEELDKTAYGSEESKRLLEDLKDLSNMAKQDREHKITEEKNKADAEEAKKTRKQNWILAAIDGGVKLIVGFGTAIVVNQMDHRFRWSSMLKAFEYEKSDIPSSSITRGIIGSLPKK